MGIREWLKPTGGYKGWTAEVEPSSYRRGIWSVTIRNPEGKKLNRSGGLSNYYWEIEAKDRKAAAVKARKVLVKQVNKWLAKQKRQERWDNQEKFTI